MEIEYVNFVNCLYVNLDTPISHELNIHVQTDGRHTLTHMHSHARLYALSHTRTHPKTFSICKVLFSTSFIVCCFTFVYYKCTFNRARVKDH